VPPAFVILKSEKISTGKRECFFAGMIFEINRLFKNIPVVLNLHPVFFGLQNKAGGKFSLIFFYLAEK
jgi:hypothetical protein